MTAFQKSGAGSNFMQNFHSPKAPSDDIKRIHNFSLDPRLTLSKIFPMYKSASLREENVNGRATAHLDSRQSCFSINIVRTCFSDSVYVVYLISRELLREKYQKESKSCLLLCLSRAWNKNYCVSLLKH